MAITNPKKYNDDDNYKNNYDYKERQQRQAMATTTTMTTTTRNNYDNYKELQRLRLQRNTTTTTTTTSTATRSIDNNISNDYNYKKQLWQQQLWLDMNDLLCRFYVFDEYMFWGYNTRNTLNLTS